ncbi:MAG TPA: hypothetical protein VFC44_04395 [Candidatus Saccharimonadales bacterium]|nr:hypothetical protein [Candidatus Saccharimonadales bacterium]
MKQAALLEGLSEASAESQANTQLGDPFTLAGRLMMALRQTSWWGRHVLIAFCGLPLLVFPVLWALLVCANLSLGFALGFGWNYQKLHLAAKNPDSFHHLVLALHCADYLATALVAILFCWLARRSAVRMAWMATACAICSFCAMFLRVKLNPHSLSVLISWNPQWVRFAIPLLIAGALYAFQWRTIEIPCEQS